MDLGLLSLMFQMILFIMCVSYIFSVLDVLSEFIN